MIADTTQLDQDVNTLWALLFSIVLDGEKRLAAYMIAHNLTPPQFYVLKTLTEQGGHCPIGEIARMHHLTNATMTGLVKRLEALDPPLVMREKSAADRRSVEVVMTPAGQERFLAVQADLMEQVRAIFSLVSPSERQDLIRYLSRYVQVMRAQFPVEAVE
jgi:DNA-binding MarR family transcriptional regulator